MATHYLLRSPMYIDRMMFTTFKDWDGALMLESDYEDPPVAGLFKHVPEPKVATPLPVQGQAFGSHEAFVAKEAAGGSSTGFADTGAVANLSLSATGSSTGAGVASATYLAYRNVGATADVAFTAEAILSEAADIGDVPGVKYPWSSLIDLAPNDRLEVGGLSDLAVNNRVQVASSGNLQRDPSYSGPDYVLGGPPDDAVSPKQLGYKKGDQLLLIGVGAHAGRILTLQDPSTWSVYEVLDPLDTNWYQFRMIRSIN